MKAGHCHVQKNGRGGGRDHIPMIQRIFTHTKSKSITDHNHVQLIQRIFTHTKSKSITDHDHFQLIQWIITQTNTNKEHYRSRTPSHSKARGSHTHMYSGFYSSDSVQRKHCPRSLSHSPVRSQKNCCKLSDTSPQKPCETSHSRSPYCS